MTARWHRLLGHLAGWAVLVLFLGPVGVLLAGLFFALFGWVWLAALLAVWIKATARHYYYWTIRRAL